MKTVLASVWDKTGLIEFLRGLESYEPLRVIATGSTAKYLSEAGFACETVDSVTGFPEILEGRVKTLHPKIFGGILAKDSQAHQAHLEEHAIPRIDYVVVNLYPFEQVSKTSKDESQIIESIDVGGVALIRAAAKNYQQEVVLPNPQAYSTVLEALRDNEGALPHAFRRQLARKAFEHTARYDALIGSYFLRDEQTGEMPPLFMLPMAKLEDLRYGENPQQRAAWYQQVDSRFERPFEQLQGKDMSANNLVDAYAACKILREFPQDPACCIIKHNNPCGAAIASSIDEAYTKAYAADPVSAFGGIFGFNRTLTETIAQDIVQHFTEIVMAPDFTPQALETLSRKKNVRVLKVPSLAQPHPHAVAWTLKDMNDFGLLLQEETMTSDMPELTNVTTQPMPDHTRSDVAFGWALVKHLTSNAVAVVKHGQTLGIGVGQTSRIASMEIALAQAGENAQGAVLASDGFFPATDNIDAAAQAGISVIVQPGGSIKDPEVIDAANQHGLAMVLTHQRCFKH